MKTKAICFFIFLSILILYGCLSLYRLPKSKEYFNQTGNCIFSEIDAPIYKLGDPQSIVMYALKSKERDINSSIHLTLAKRITGKQIKILTYEPDIYKNHYIDEFDLFKADGKQYIYARHGKLKAITNDCESIYFNPSDIFQEDPNIITTLDSSVINGIDKIAIAGHLKQMFTNFKVNIRGDDFDKDKWIETPSIGGVFLRALIDKDSNKLLFIQIYAKTTHISDWANLNRASDKNGNNFKVVYINSDVSCMRLSCIYYELIGIDIPFDYLKSNLTGISIKAYGRSGSAVINIPEQAIKIMLDALNNYTV